MGAWAVRDGRDAAEVRAVPRARGPDAERLGRWLRGGEAPAQQLLQVWSSGVPVGQPQRARAALVRPGPYKVPEPPRLPLCLRGSGGIPGRGAHLLCHGLCHKGEPLRVELAGSLSGTAARSGDAAHRQAGANRRALAARPGHLSPRHLAGECGPRPKEGRAHAGEAHRLWHGHALAEVLQGKAVRQSVLLRPGDVPRQGVRRLP
mmetsp:Transcript_92616/g.299645  ORF Transcript_92616/g.299645 Transcript_92616/m.299645 type:complete len:205 (+) Transcript_92616:759-1373(+)